MKLSELEGESQGAGVIRAAKRRQPPYNRPRSVEVVAMVDGGLRQVVLIENQDGRAEYMFRYPDGHLGSVTDDC